MNSIDTNKTRRLERFRTLYREAAVAASEEHEAMRRCLEQYLGSRKIDGSNEEASYVRNITFEIIEGEIDPDVPYPKTDPRRGSPEKIRNAAAIERLCRAVRAELPFEELNECDERFTYVYGASVWYVEWDQTVKGGGVKLHALPPTAFVGQPGITKVEDMEYCFLRFTTTRGELMRKYGISREKAEAAEVEFEYGSFGSDDDTVTLVIAFYRDGDGEIGRLVFSGEVLISDIPKFYRRKSRACLECGEPDGRCKCGGEVGYFDVSTESFISESGEEISLPYYVLSDYPIVIRKNTSGGTAVFGISDAALIRDQQQAINKLETRILKKLLRAGIYPVMPEDASVTASNTVFGEVIRMRPGENAENYGKLDTTPDIRQDIEAADRIYDQAKRIIGITDALVGQDQAVSESGYARELKLKRAAGRLEAKKRTKYHVYSKLFELIFKHYLAFSDGKIHIGADDRCFDRHQFIELLADGRKVYDDSYLFSVDLNSSSEYGRSALWERNLENLESGTLGDKSEPETLKRYWKLQEKVGYPFAKENVEDFCELLKEKKNNETTIERKAYEE